MQPKVSVFIAATLDNFIARPNGNLDWLDTYNTPGEDYGYQALFNACDILLMGRHTFEVVNAFPDWPYGDKPLRVLTSGVVEIPAALADRVQCSSRPPAKLVEQLREAGYRHLYIDGGETIRRFLAANLVDEITLTRVPLLLGVGVPLFTTLPGEIALEHLATQSYPNGLVQSRYRVVSASSR